MSAVPDEGSTIVVAGVTLTVQRRRDACEATCSAWSHYQDALCGDRCNDSGHHGRHECVDGHTFDFDPDDKQPEEGWRWVGEWVTIPPPAASAEEGERRG